MPQPTDTQFAAKLLALAAERAPKTVCRSEAAHRRTDDWRPLVPDIRRVAAELPLLATQSGQPVDPAKARGSIRLSACP